MENKDYNNSVNGENGSGENNSEFSFVKETVRSGRNKKVKKALYVIGVSFAAAIVFGLTARAVYAWSGPLFERSEGKQSASGTEDAEYDYENLRSEVVIGSKDQQGKQGGEDSVPTKPVKPTKEPTKEPTKTPSVSPSDEPTAQPTAEPDSTKSGSDGTASGVTAAVTPKGVVIGGSSSQTAGTVGETSDNEGEDAADGGDVSAESGTDAMGEGADAPNAAGSDETAAGSEDNGAQNGEDTSALLMYVRMISEMKDVASDVGHSLTKVHAINGGVNWLDENIETQSTHTGTIVGDNGVELLILTCFSEVAAADRVEVEFEDGTSARGSLYGMYADMDIAIVAVSLGELSEETLGTIKYISTGDAENIVSGEPVIAIGSTNGYAGSMNFGFITSSGMKAYVYDGVADLYTLDIDYHKGADGVIVNLAGEMIGLISEKLGDPDSEVCTAVSLDSILTVLNKLANRLKIPYTGIRAENIPDKILEGMGIENGIYVNEVAAGSPAAVAGIRKGDVVMTVNKLQIGSVEEYSSLLAGMQMNEKMTVEVFRSSAAESNIKLTVRVTGK